MDFDGQEEVCRRQIQELRNKLDSVNDEFRKQIAICQRLEAKFHSYPLCSWCWHLTASKEGIDWKGQAYRSCRKIHASASLGCPLCRSVLENAKPKIVDKRNVYFGYESSKWEPRLKHFRASDREDSNNQASGIRVFIKESTVSPGYEYLPEYFMYVELYKSPGDAASKAVPTKPRIAQPSSQFTFASLRDHLRNCSANHSCSSNTPPVLPTRVLYVGETNEDTESEIASLPLKLHTSIKGEREQYMALSYCWGGPQDIVTTRENLDSHLKEMDMTALPKTIQDAVKVTRQLQIKYLWVDALCILQDDGPDKMREIARMGQVYQNAKITIAASRSYSVKNGFLQDYAFPESIESQIYCGPDRSRTKIWMVPQAVAEILDDPLASRGWTFQEHLLSPRLLHYGSKGLTWHCQKELILPVLPYNVRYTLEGDSNGLIWQAFKRETAMSRNHEDNVGSGHSRTHGFWLHMVEQYSRRTLTFANDRLLAISGIASEISRTHPFDDYLAGHWKKDLVRSLLWRRVATGILLPNRTASLRNLEVPTWSWASISAPIIYELTLGDDAKFLRSDVQPKLPSAPFGSVTGKTLILSAKVLRVKRRDLMMTRLPVKVSLDDPNADFKYDGLYTLHKRERIWIMKLGGTYLGGPLGLVLSQIMDSAMRFKRVGLFYSCHRAPDVSLRELLSTLETREVEVI